MNDVAAPIATTATSTPVEQPGPTDGVYRGRLFRKYLVLILTLVSIALLASGGISLYFTYEETKSALASLQHEKALAAASRIEQYIRQIERQITSAALPQLDASDVEARRIEFLKALRQAPEITDIAEVDGAGREQIAVSRLGMDSLRSNKDRSQDPAFMKARRGQAFFSPVYFRKETEPYMTIAVRSAGDKGPVTIAEVNLKFVWDVVSRIKIGESGKAYVVDANGFLVADPDIGLVLRKTNLSDLPHVRAAKQRAAGNEELAMLSRDIGGTEVLASLAPIESLNWNVFVEQPVAEVYRKLNASISRTGVLLLAGLLLSALGAWALARGMVRPIRTLEEGAQRIGAGDLDQAIDIKTGDELESLADGFNRMSSRLKESYAGLERKVEERTRALQNSLEQQTAISDILRVISSSPTDVQPVLKAVAERAVHLCEANVGGVFLVDHGMLKPMADYSIGRETAPAVAAVPLRRTSITGRAVLDRETVHHADAIPLIDTEFPDARATQQKYGFRAVLAVPLVRESGAYGGIFLYRREPKPFTEYQIALVETFARQAAIAIDNVRLFNETKRALEQQTAISEILRVISSSPTDVQPVLDAVAERAAHLCDAPTARVLVIDGELLRPKAQYTTGGESLPSVTPTVLKRTSMNGRAALDRKTVHVTDVVPILDTEFPDGKENALRQGIRSVLAVPLVREGGAYGTILLWRREVKPFTPDQVALVETFAQQAAIAIDNVRLFNETKEALEQQTAISEILRVISSSPTDVQPVLDAIAERAVQLCDASSASMYLTDGDQLRHLASKGPTAEPVTHLEAFPINQDSISGRALLDRKTIHIADMLAVANQYPLSAAIAQEYGHRAVVVMPLFREGKPFGTIVLRRVDVRPFSEREIALLSTFGDQAAIALENVRLFNETKEALEQQRASGEVLTAISNSIADSKPVFDVILASCQRLFEGDIVGITLLREDGMLDVGANAGRQFEELKKIFPQPLSRDSASGIAILDRKMLAFADIESDDMPPRSRDGCRSIGTQSMAFAPMVFEGRGIGTLWIGRSFKGAFSEKQLTLLKTFAEQAVIAIQNARLFNETKEALEQQRASGEVLAAISSSIADTKPVFDKILQSCEQLFAGKTVVINLIGEDGLLRLAAYHGPGREELEKLFPMPVDAETGSGAAILRRSVLHVPDIEHGEDAPPKARIGCGLIGVKAAIYAPLMWEEKGIGAIFVGRDYVGPFSDKDIALLKTFADQAVIAIQNARLFNETNEALERQTATSEILRVISESPTDVKPVLEAVAKRAGVLCRAEGSRVWLVSDGQLRAMTSYGPGYVHGSTLEVLPLRTTSVGGRAVLERRVLHVEDVVPLIDSEYPDIRELQARHGFRTVLNVPLIREGEAIGVLSLLRKQVLPFAPAEISLLKTFADQAVIAIENSRLFNETKEALDQQRASGEVLATISSSIADTTPVFDKILESCERLFAGRTIGINLVSEDGLIRLGAYHGPGREELEKIWPAPVDEETGTGRAILTRQIAHFPDVDDASERTRRACKAIGVKGCIFAPMLWESRGIGAIFVGRDYVGSFSDKEIALLKTFADQAVIAIQNARLFREIEDKSRQLEVANKHKSEFLANMSHELRTPLNAIIGFSEVLLERFFGDVNEKQDDYLKDIHSSGKHLLSLINDILDLSKVEAGRMELEPASFDVSSALSNAMTLIRERAQRHGITLGQDVDPMLGEIVADERKFKQILLNLLTNAVKFTPDGGQINVSARKDDSQAVIAVRDTGIGIAAEDQAAVFEEFRQVGHDYTRKAEGTGLGLALTRKFVELHGGQIRVDSEPGKGSTFTFTIPLQPDKAALH